MQNTIQELTTPILNKLDAFYSQKKHGAADWNYRNEIINLIANLEKSTIQQKISKKQAEYIKYALVALIDETILASNWIFRDQWLHHPLQEHYYRERLAGDGFYTRLERLQREPQKNINLLELYYVCLQLGFKGKYRAKPPELLQSLAGQLYKQIKNIRQQTKTKAHPEHNIKKGEKTKKDLHYITIVLTATLIAIFLIYLIANTRADKQTQAAIQKIITRQQLQGAHG